tara:strand:+ start:86906 stop:88333 length:1428 start_codon:yes stop_codon:yes gene_type:complete
MLPSIPNGMAQSYATAKAKLDSINNLSVSTCGVSLSSLRNMVAASEQANSLKMTTFADQFSDMKLYSAASGMEEDAEAKRTIGGVGRLLKDITSGKFSQELLDSIDSIEGAVRNGQCALLSGLISAARSALDFFDELVDGTSRVNDGLSQLGKDIMEKVSKIMMMIGGALEGFTPFSDCFEVAAVHSPSVGESYNIATDLAADLRSGTVPKARLPLKIRENTRKQNLFSERVIAAQDQMPIGRSRDTLEDYMAAYEVQQKEEDDKNADGGLGNVGTETPDPIVDPVVEHDYESDKWTPRLAEWQWNDNNSVAISLRSRMQKGILEYEDLSRTTWQGHLNFNIASQATHRYAAGLVLGTLANGNYVGIVKRGTTGLALFEFEPNTLNTPITYEPETDHGSEQVFETWADTKAVAMRLVADDTYFTVYAADIDDTADTNKFDMLQVPRATLTTQNVGFIALGQGIAFHIVERTDNTN